MNILLDLFLAFAKIGLFTFGGGYAMIALIENVCVEKKKWITHDDMMNVTVWKAVRVRVHTRPQARNGNCRE